MESKTLGESRVRVDFNVTGDDVVTQIKIKAAELIDLIDSIEGGGLGEVSRLKAIGMTAIEEGAMWGVKAATAQK